MIKTEKPITIVDVVLGNKKVFAKTIDIEKGEQDELWDATGESATIEEMNKLRDELEITIGEKADASDITTINTALGLKASQDDLDSLSGVVDGKAEQSEVDTLASDVAEKASSLEIQKKYDMLRLRGDNLITNGMGEMGDTTNFPAFSRATFFITAEDREIFMFFKQAPLAYTTTEEYVPIHPSKAYNMKLKGISVGTNIRCGAAFYDCKKNRIYSSQEPAPSLTKEEAATCCELAQPFDTRTDTVIHLKQGHAALWLERYAKSKQGYYAEGCFRIQKVDYGDGIDFGCQYMKYWAFDIWEEAGVDETNDTITLTRLISENDVIEAGVFPAGTYIDSSCDSSGMREFGEFFHVYSSSGMRTPFEGIISNNEDAFTRIPQGAIYFRLFIEGAYYGGGIGVSGVELREIVSTPKTVSEQIESERPDASYKNSEIVADDIPALPQSKITDLSAALSAKASNDDVTALQTSVATKASLPALALTTNMDVADSANLQNFLLGPIPSPVPNLHATEAGLFMEVRTPVYLKQAKIYMKQADTVTIQLYKYYDNVVIFDEDYSVTVGENTINLGVLLPAGLYYLSSEATGQTIGYFPTTEYNTNHHFVSIVGGELDPIAFPSFSAGTTSQWAGLYQLQFQVPFKALYLGFLPAKEANNNLIKGAFYHVNDSGKLLIWCYDGASQIANS